MPIYGLSAQSYIIKLYVNLSINSLKLYWTLINLQDSANIFGKGNFVGTFPFVIVFLDFEVTIVSNVSSTLEEHLMRKRRREKEIKGRGEDNFHFSVYVCMMISISVTIIFPSVFGLDIYLLLAILY